MPTRAARCCFTRPRFPSSSISADRVLVLYAAGSSAEIPASELTEEAILRAALGGDADAAEGGVTMASRGDACRAERLAAPRAAPAPGAESAAPDRRRGLPRSARDRRQHRRPGSPTTTCRNGGERRRARARGDRADHRHPVGRLRSLGRRGDLAGQLSIARLDAAGPVAGAARRRRRRRRDRHGGPAPSTASSSPSCACSRSW